MSETEDKALWEEICFDLHNTSTTMSEELYEQKIIMSLDKMGWKQFKGEIILKQNIPVGSSQSIVPDIIVRSKDENIAFVIEVKKPSIALTEWNRKQLFSYMRQLKLEFGILFGENIEIFFDDKLSYSNNPIKLKTINFNDKNNIDFVKIFKKQALSAINLQKYAKENLDIVNSEKEKNDLRKEILSPEFALKLKDQVKQMLLEKWNEEIIDDIIEGFIVSINIKDRNAEEVKSAHSYLSSATNSASYSIGKVEYLFDPQDEKEFKKQLLKSKQAHIKIFYKDGREEYRAWNTSNFTDDSNLRGNINSKTWFRQDYIQRNGVVKAIFSINPF